MVVTLKATIQTIETQILTGHEKTDGNYHGQQVRSVWLIVSTITLSKNMDARKDFVSTKGLNKQAVKHLVLELISSKKPVTENVSYLQDLWSKVDTT